MKKHILIIAFLLALTLSATIVAELNQTACVDTDFIHRQVYLDSQNIINLYNWDPSSGQPIQKLWVKRIHPDGTEEEPYLLFDFDDPVNLGSGFHRVLHRIQAEDGMLFVFSNLTHMVALTVHGLEVQPYVIAGSEIAHFNGWYSFPLSGGNFLIFAGTEGYGHRVWKWNYQSGECIPYYDVPDLFDSTWVTMLGDTMVLSEWRQDATDEIVPVLVVDSDLNATQHQAYQYSIRVLYMLDDETCYAHWEEDGEYYNGIIHIGNGDFVADHWTSTADTDETAGIDSFSLALPNSIYGAWNYKLLPIGENPYELYQEVNTFRLYQRMPNGIVTDYSGFPNINTDDDNYLGALKIKGKLLLIHDDEETYSFELADMETLQYIDFVEDTWQPDLGENGSLQTDIYNTDEYIVFKMLMSDVHTGVLWRYYFLSFNEKVSTSDLVEPVPTLSAYPNPFTESVQISSSKKQGEATLDIYNLKGQKVKSIRTRDAKYVWDGKDEKGNSLGAGIYFLREDNHAKPVKIIKLKP